MFWRLFIIIFFVAKRWSMLAIWLLALADSAAFHSGLRSGTASSPRSRPRNRWPTR